MMNKIRDRIKRNRLVNDTKAQLGLLLFLPSMFKLITLLIIVFLIVWILSNLMSIALGIILIAVAIFLVIGAVVLFKKYVLPQKKEATE
jgi:membrane associated rhomboid family serine protease